MNSWRLIFLGPSVHLQPWHACALWPSEHFQVAVHSKVAVSSLAFACTPWRRRRAQARAHFGEERALAEAHYRLSAPLFNLAFILIAAAAYLAGDYSRMGYGRRIATAVGAGLTLRLVGFSVQSAATDDPALNFAPYMIPLIGILGALAVIYWPGRSRPEAPATSQAEAR